MWYLGIAGAWAWQFFARGKYTPLHNWLHAPVTRIHLYELMAAAVISLIIAMIMTFKMGEPIPRLPDYSGIFMAAAIGFVGWLWYLTQVRPNPAAANPQPTVTVTAGHATVVHTVGVNWQLVAVFGIGGAVVLAVLYLVIRYIVA